MKYIYIYSIIIISACILNIAGIIDAGLSVKYILASCSPLLFVLFSSIYLFKIHRVIHTYWSVFSIAFMGIYCFYVFSAISSNTIASGYVVLIAWGTSYAVSLLAVVIIIVSACLNYRKNTY